MSRDSRFCHRYGTTAAFELLTQQEHPVGVLSVLQPEDDGAIILETGEPPRRRCSAASLGPSPFLPAALAIERLLEFDDPKLLQAATDAQQWRWHGGVTASLAHTSASLAHTSSGPTLASSGSAAAALVMRGRLGGSSLIGGSAMNVGPLGGGASGSTLFSVPRSAGGSAVGGSIAAADAALAEVNAVIEGRWHDNGLPHPSCAMPT